MTDQSRRGAKKRILILDDEPHVVTYLETLLQDHGYEAISATDGRQGIAKAESEAPDLICLDVTMPKTSGIRIFREMKKRPELAKIPVIIVTAVTGLGHDVQSFHEYISNGEPAPVPDGFFTKPIDREAFIAAVDRLLG